MSTYLLESQLEQLLRPHTPIGYRKMAPFKQLLLQSPAYPVCRGWEDPSELRQSIATPFFIGSALLLAIIPYTIFVIKPKTLDYLLDPKIDKASPKTAEILDNWGNMHLVRTLASCAGLLFFLEGAAVVE